MNLLIQGRYDIIDPPPPPVLRLTGRYVITANGTTIPAKYHATDSLVVEALPITAEIRSGGSVAVGKGRIVLRILTATGVTVGLGRATVVIPPNSKVLIRTPLLASFSSDLTASLYWNGALVKQAAIDPGSSLGSRVEIVYDGT